MLRVVAELARGAGDRVDGRATLTFVFDEAFFQVQLEARAVALDDAPLACFVATIETGELQSVGYARLTSGICLNWRKSETVMTRWRAQVEMLKRAASAAAEKTALVPRIGRELVNVSAPPSHRATVISGRAAPNAACRGGRHRCHRRAACRRAAHRHPPAHCADHSNARDAAHRLCAGRLELPFGLAGAGFLPPFPRGVATAVRMQPASPPSRRGAP